MYFDNDDRRRRGFTLVELMVSIVLGALLIGVVLQFVNGQTRVATAQSGREEVQQNARGALEVVGSDLRGAIQAGVVFAGDREIEVMLPRRWGVVCAQAGGTSTTVLFPNLPGQPVPAGPGAGLLLLDTVTTRGWQPALPALATVAVATPVGVTPACAALSSTGNVVAFQLQGAGHPGVSVGSTAALYQMTRYDVGESRGARWIRRSNGMDAAGTYSMQPLAGPVDEEAGGISFTYFTNTPPVELAVAPGALAPAALLSQVRLRVNMKSRQGGSASQVEFDSTTVQIRNDFNN